MNFMKVKVRQETEGKPGFMAEELFDVNINVDQITLFNKSEDDNNITFVRLNCGATLILAMKYAEFVTRLKKLTGKAIEK